MALTFPSSPTNGQIYTDTVTGYRYIYNATAGVWSFSSNNVGMSVSSTPPSNVGSGSMWYNREIGRTFVYYDDGDSKQWVETVPATGSFDGTLVSSYANTAATVAVTPAFAKANAALANTTGTFAGSLSLTGNLALGGIATSSIPFETPCDSAGTALKIRGRPSTNDAAIRWYSNDGVTQQGYVQFGGQAEFTLNGPNNFIISSNSTTRMFFNGSTGDIGIGTNGISTNGVTGRLSILGQNFTNSNESGTLNLSCSDALASDIGGSISFSGNYQSSTSAKAAFARIYGNKENGTNNNWDGYIGFAVAKGGSPAERMRIDSNGYVTKSNQPSWFYIGGTTLVNSTNVVTKPSTAVISNANYNTSTGLFTAPVAGKYLIGVWGLLYPHSSTVLTVYAWKNGGAYGQGVQGGWANGNHTPYSATVLVDLAVNDTVGFAFNRAGASDGVNAYSTQWNQWGYLLG